LKFLFRFFNFRVSVGSVAGFLVVCGDVGVWKFNSIFEFSIFRSDRSLVSRWVMKTAKVEFSFRVLNFRVCVRRIGRG
jgi:hypothetical protein